MIKINFPILDESLSIEGFTVLVLENTTIFSNLVKNFYDYSECNSLKVYMDTDYKELKEREIMLVTDILGFDLNSPSLLKIIYDDLLNQLNEKPQVKLEIEQLVNKLTALISFECLENEFDLEYDEITILEILKALGIKLETNSSSIFDRMLEIIQVFRCLPKMKLLVFVNCFSYLSVSEINSLQKYVLLQQINVLFLEPRKFKGIPQIVIDEDYYISFENMI